MPARFRTAYAGTLRIPPQGRVSTSCQCRRSCCTCQRPQRRPGRDQRENRLRTRGQGTRGRDRAFKVHEGCAEWGTCLANKKRFWRRYHVYAASWCHGQVLYCATPVLRVVIREGNAHVKRTWTTQCLGETQANLMVVGGELELIKGVVAARRKHTPRVKQRPRSGKLAEGARSPVK